MEEFDMTLQKASEHLDQEKIDKSDFSLESNLEKDEVSETILDSDSLKKSEKLEEIEDKPMDNQLIGSDDSVETERINVLPGPDYVPIRKINNLPMERPTTLNIRPIESDSENTEFNLAEYLTKRLHSIADFVCDFWFFACVYYVLYVIYKLTYPEK